MTTNQPTEEAVKIAQELCAVKIDALTEFLDIFKAPELGNLMVALQWHAKRFREGEFIEIVRERYIKELEKHQVSDCYKNG